MLVLLLYFSFLQRRFCFNTFSYEVLRTIPNEYNTIMVINVWFLLKKFVLWPTHFSMSSNLLINNNEIAIKPMQTRVRIKQTNVSKYKVNCVYNLKQYILLFIVVNT